MAGPFGVMVDRWSMRSGAVAGVNRTGPGFVPTRSGYVRGSRSSTRRPRRGHPRRPGAEGADRVGHRRLDLVEGLGDGVAAADTQPHRLPAADHDLPGDDDGRGGGVECGRRDPGHDLAGQALPVEAALPRDDEVVPTNRVLE